MRFKLIVINSLAGKSISKLKNEIKIANDSRSLDLGYERYFNLIAEVLNKANFFSLDDILNFKNTGIKVFRARRLYDDKLFEDENDLWARDASLVTELGRCNNINESRFYCSNDFLTCFVECRAPSNSNWVLVEYEFINTEPIITVPLGINYHLFKSLPDYESSLEQKKKDKIIVGFLRAAFKDKVTSQNKRKYFKTIAITNFFLNGDNLKDRNACILYPSVADYNKNYNYVLKSEVARNNLKVKNIYHVHLENVSVNRSRGNANLKFTKKGIISNSRIIWTNYSGNPYPNY